MTSSDEHGVLTLFGTPLPEDKPAPASLVMRLLCEVAALATRHTITESPLGRMLFYRLNNPYPGDVVVEVSSFRLDPSGLGIFVERLWNRNHVDGENQKPFCHLWRIQSLSTGVRVNWDNAEFRVVPTQDVFAWAHDEALKMMRKQE